MALSVQVSRPFYQRIISRNRITQAGRDAVKRYLTDILGGNPVPEPQADPHMGNSDDHPLKTITLSIPIKHEQAMRKVAKRREVPVGHIARAALLHYTRSTRVPEAPVVRTRYNKQVGLTGIDVTLLERILTWVNSDGSRSVSDVWREVLMAFLDHQAANPATPLPTREEIRLHTNGSYSTGFYVSEAQYRSLSAMAAYYRVTPTFLIRCAFYRFFSSHQS